MHTSLHPFLFFACILLIGGCKKLPQAPETLEELTNFLFEHFDDEDQDNLESGLINLEEWLSLNMEQANQGYKVEDLSLQAIESLDGNNLTLEGQVGVSVAFDVWYSPENVTNTLVMVGSDELYPDNYIDYERTFLTDPECFTNHTCDRADWEASSQSSYPLNIKVTTTGRTQYRWVEMEDGYAAVSRNWMISPAEVSVDWLELEQQYSLSALIYRNGITRKLDAGWVILRLGALPLPENSAINMAAANMLDAGEDLEAYLDTYGPFF